MTPEHKELLSIADDLANHAAKEATDRALTIASVVGDSRLICMIGVKASKLMLDAFLMSAIKQAGMPREAAEFTARTIAEHLLEHIAEHFDKKEEAA